MKIKEKHKHVFEPVEHTIPLYSYEVAPNGGYTQGGTVARDTIKGFKCTCGYKIASDVERKIL